MIYKRHYLQFNDLVFDDYHMIEESDSSVSFKTNSHEYTFRHGDYTPFKNSSMQTEAGSVSFTLRLQMKKLPCHVRRFYPQYVASQLTTVGKLWAVQYNTLIWAYAYITSYNLVEDVRKDELKIDCDFDLPEGIWHKADKQRTFLAPFDKCEFMDCLGYKDIQPCRTEYSYCCECVSRDQKNMGATECDCCCEVSKDMALCYYSDDLQFLYDRCGSGYKIVTNCAAGEKFFGKSKTEYIGQRLVGNCGVISGLLYSDTEIPTDGVKIKLHGSLSNPQITINGNTNTISGSYDGDLTVYPDGSVYYSENCCDTLLDVSKWVIPDGMEYGWTVNPGNNRIRIDGISGVVTADFEIDALTI